MSQDEDNPHLANEVPGSWDIPFKRWIIGIGIAAWLVVSGMIDIFNGHSRFPVPFIEEIPTSWLEVSGVGSVFGALVKISAGVILYSRYFMRFHIRMWKSYHQVEWVGGVICLLSLIVASIFIVKQNL